MSDEGYHALAEAGQMAFAPVNEVERLREEVTALRALVRKLRDALYAADNLLESANVASDGWKVVAEADVVLAVGSEETR